MIQVIKRKTQKRMGQWVKEEALGNSRSWGWGQNEGDQERECGTHFDIPSS